MGLITNGIGIDGIVLLVVVVIIIGRLCLDVLVVRVWWLLSWIVVVINVG